MKWFLFFLFLLIYIPASANDSLITIRGRIVDFDSGQRLEGAGIFCGKAGTISDSRGFFELKLNPGKQNISIQYVGYETQVNSIVVSPGQMPVFEFSLKKKINEIEQIVISASKFEEKLSDINLSISLIKPYEINKQHISNPQELINKVPGVEVLDGQASIRGGSGFSYGAGSRVLALIDGLPVLSADAGNIKWQFLPLDNLSQIEVIKGASSVMYGSSALNGVINFRSTNPTEIPRSKFRFTSGIYDSPSNSKWKWWNTPRMQNSLSFSHSVKKGKNDFGLGSALVYDNGYRKNNNEKLGRINLKYKRYSEKLKDLQYGANLNAGYTQKTDFVLWENAETGGLIQSETVANELRGSFFTLDPFINYTSGRNTHHSLKSRFQYTSNFFEEAKQNNSDANSFYTEYQIQKSIKEIYKLNLGLSENFSKIESPFYDNHTGLNIAAFFQMGTTLFEKLKLSGGLRIEQNFLDGESDEMVPVFRTGANYRLGKASFLRASFGQGYRYPSIAEKFASTTLGSIKIFPNHDIKPEYGWNTELGIKQGLNYGILTGMFDLSFFYSQNKDMIEYIFGLFSEEGSGVPELGFMASNIENSRVYGYETELLLQISSGQLNHRIRWGYTFMYPIEFNHSSGKNTDIYLKYRRKHSAQLNYNLGFQKFEANLYLYFKSKILEIDNVFTNELSRETILPGFYNYWIENNDARLIIYHFLPRYSLSFLVKNIANVEYMGRPGDIRPHRNLSLSFGKNF